MPMNPKVLPTLLGVLMTTAAATAATAQTIGAVTAVNQSAKSILPSAGGARMLALGQDVVFNETIETNAKGSAQVSFVDRSTLNVGRNSSVVIDRFVYNPGSSGNTMALTLSRGVLRFVGGEISHNNVASIKTPVATIGVRGGSTTVGAGQGGGCNGVLIINNVGTLTLKNNVDQLTITQPGYGVCVTSPNEPFPPPFLVPDDMLKAYTDSATSGNGQHGGVNDLPLDALFDRFGLQLPTLPPSGNPFDFVTIIDGGNSSAGSHAQDDEQGTSSSYSCSYSCSY